MRGVLYSHSMIKYVGYKRTQNPALFSQFRIEKTVALATRIKYGPFIDMNIIYVLSILGLNISKMTWNVYDVYDLFIHTK